MPEYRLRIPAVSGLWKHIRHAQNERDAVRAHAKQLNSKTIEYDDPRCYEVEEVRYEACQYCGTHYHPMPRYTNNNGMIFVCHFRPVYDDGGEFVRLEETDCREKAKSHGYRFRRDLTPRR